MKVLSNLTMEGRQRVDEEELDWDDDVSVLDGVPYSGIGYLKFPDGTPRREVEYVDGFEEGKCTEWHSNGNLSREWVANRGRAEGTVAEWHANGVLKSVGEYERGVELSFAEWDESGAVVLTRNIDESSKVFEYLEHMRRRNP